MRAATNALLALPIVAVSPYAFGDEGDVPFRLEYRAPATCPTADAFLSQVRVRTRRPRLAREGERAPLFVVVLEPGADRARGELRVRDENDDSERVRTVSSASCAELADALALIAALTLDPNASTAPHVEAPPASSSAPAPRPPASSPIAAPPTPRLRSVEAFVGVDAAIQTAVAPDVVGSGALFAGVTWIRRLTLRLDVQRSLADTVTTPIGSATFTWTSGTLGACPFPFGPRPLTVELCAAAQVGVLEGVGEGPPNARAQRFAWVAPELLGRVRVRWPSPLFFEGQAGGVLPLVPVRFFFEPSTPVWSTPTVGATVSVGVGSLFP
jgi:hypothetical protein